MTAPFLRRWLGGWRGVLVTLAFAALMTALGLYVQAHSVGGLRDPQFRLVARAAGAADLFFVLRFLSEVVDWLHRQSVKLQRHVERALSGEWREKPHALLWRG
jgi:hypothetical protein